MPEAKRLCEASPLRSRADIAHQTLPDASLNPSR